jgi:hypothetical protein
MPQSDAMLQGIANLHMKTRIGDRLRAEELAKRSALREDYEAMAKAQYYRSAAQKDKAAAREDQLTRNRHQAFQQSIMPYDDFAKQRLPANATPEQVRQVGVEYNQYQLGQALNSGYYDIAENIQKSTGTMTNLSGVNIPTDVAQTRQQTATSAKDEALKAAQERFISGVGYRDVRPPDPATIRMYTSTFSSIDPGSGDWNPFTGLSDDEKRMMVTTAESFRNRGKAMGVDIGIELAAKVAMGQITFEQAVQVISQQQGISPEMQPSAAGQVAPAPTGKTRSWNDVPD